eukprot:132220-Prorocentrum_minimum.AAC.1
MSNIQSRGRSSSQLAIAVTWRYMHESATAKNAHPRHVTGYPVHAKVGGLPNEARRRQAVPQPVRMSVGGEWPSCGREPRRGHHRASHLAKVAEELLGVA